MIVDRPNLGVWFKKISYYRLTYLEGWQKGTSSDAHASDFDKGVYHGASFLCSVLMQVWSLESKIKIFCNLNVFKRIGVYCVAVFYWFLFVYDAKNLKFRGIELY